MNTNIKLLTATAVLSLLSACAPLPQNVQHGNSTGKVEDNKWDYYNGNPVHYTTLKRSVYKNKVLVINEATDKFGLNVNIDLKRDFAILEMNGKIVNLWELKNNELIEEFLTKRFPDRAKMQVVKMEWDRYYRSALGDYYLAINIKKNNLFASFEEIDASQDFLYQPSRFLACKKIAIVKREKDSAVVANLLRTALVAGVQSYTSYSYSNVYSNYGNFGYAVTRDFSWAGERAGEALGTLFAGEYSEAKLNHAWNSLNCW